MSSSNHHHPPSSYLPTPSRSSYSSHSSHQRHRSTPSASLESTPVASTSALPPVPSLPSSPYAVPASLPVVGSQGQGRVNGHQGRSSMSSRAGGSGYGAGGGDRSSAAGGSSSSGSRSRLNGHAHSSNTTASNINSNVNGHHTPVEARTPRAVPSLQLPGGRAEVRDAPGSSRSAGGSGSGGSGSASGLGGLNGGVGGVESVDTGGGGLSMSNYQLGEPLGKGASAQVYKALNWTSGETVAVKQISLSDIPKGELGDIMSEIDLLKNLNHDNIVKYKGFFKSNEYLYIILEYCENGSLQTILKRYGKFPEDLVGVFVLQVLQGLIYLHSQGVIHRDIKGANILTNKDGKVKLADFGVATMMPGLGLGLGEGKDGTGGGGDDSVVGSPYWMAPEVIEQNGATTSSDIWSVGCVVIELLEGKPPYHALEPMQALFRIVQDDCPAIPEGASGMVKDFLYQCFQKDPNLRISAKKLAKHPWMLAAQRQIDSSRAQGQGSAASTTRTEPATPIRGPPSPTRASNNLTPSVSFQGENKKPKVIIPKRPKSGHSRVSSLIGSTSILSPAPATTGGKEERGGLGDLKRRPLTTVYDEAVQRVQQWNEALQAAPKSQARPLRRVPNLRSDGAIARTAKLVDSESVAQSSSGESLAAHMASVARKPNGMWSRSLLPKDDDDVRELSDQEGSVWDDDFAGSPDLQRFEEHRHGKAVNEEPDNMKTIKPTKSPLSSPPEANRPFSSFSMRSNESKLRGAEIGDDDDFSDLLGGGEADLNQKVATFRLMESKKQSLYRPEDISKLSVRSDIQPSIPTSPRKLSDSTFAARPRLPSSGSAGSLSSRSPSRASSFRFASPQEEEQIKAMQEELSKYAEGDEEGYDDVFGPTEEDAVDKKLRSASSTDMLKLGTRRSDRSQAVNSEEDDDFDPFAEIEDSFTLIDVEANLLRDKHATLCNSINALIEDLQPNAKDDAMRNASYELLNILEEAPDLQDHFVSTHGMLAALEVLESSPSREVILNLLKIINLIITSEPAVLENLCLMGAILTVKAFTSKRYSLETRLEASHIVRWLTSSALTLQMFISCRGLKVLVDLLDEDYSSNRDLVLSALRGVNSVFELQTPTPKIDFCRIFIREGIADPLAATLLSVVKDDASDMEQSRLQILSTVLLFCQVAQSDQRIREALGTRSFTKRILRACSGLAPVDLVIAVKSIKHLSTSPFLLDVLQNADTISVMIRILGDNLASFGTTELCSHVYQTLFNLCRLSRARQEEAALNGLIPLLKRTLDQNSPLKQFALPMLCDMVTAGKAARRQLWKIGGVRVYLELLLDPYWRVVAFEAVVSWLQDETAQVEDDLMERDALESIKTAFVKAVGTSFEGILEPFLKTLRLSNQLAKALSVASVYKRIADGLTRKAKPLAKLHLLRIIKVFCEYNPHYDNSAEWFELATVVEDLGRHDEAILVRQLAKEIASSIVPRDGNPALSGSTFEPSPRPPAMRRTASEAPMIAPPERSRDDNQKHKRKLSRHQLSNIRWTEENGKVTPVFGDTPNRSAIRPSTSIGITHSKDGPRSRYKPRDHV